MAQFSEADMIWNRACAEDPPRALSGDRALADLLHAHGLVMNGGVIHAIECMNAQELANAEAGYRFFGFNDVASLLFYAQKVIANADDLCSHEQHLDIAYAQMIPSDGSLVERLRSI